MKKNLKKGFTLVECVVAMAILVVMSLLLSMLLTATVNLRNHNVKVENDIDAQVDKIAQKQDLSDENLDASGTIKIGGVTISGAKKVYFSDPSVSDVQIGALNYGIAGSGGGGDDGDDEDDDGDDADAEEGIHLVYGALDISGPVTFTEVTDNSTNGYGMYPDYDSQIVNAVWKVAFDPTGIAAPERSLKIVLPEGADPVAYKIVQNTSCTVHDIGNSTIRFEPTSNDTMYHTEVYIEFQIDTSLYDYKTPSEHYGSNQVAKDSNI